MNSNGGNNSGNVVYIKFMGFSDELNVVMNDAIDLSGSTSCQSVSIIHIFMSILKDTEIGANILDNMGLSYDKVNRVYMDNVKRGEYGYFDSSNVPFTPEFLSSEVHNILGNLGVQTIMGSKQGISTLDMYNSIISINESEVTRFIDDLGLDRSVLKPNPRKMKFRIPEEFAEFVENVFDSNEVLNQTIANVDNYVDDVIEILSRKMKANPCIVGEAGVGKTSIVYRLAQRIMLGEVPNSLKDYHICYINGSTLTSGTKYRGEFEERMKAIMDWASSVNVILFLDEIHTFVNANTGSGSGAESAGNMIKKYLSDGSIKVIGTTTLKEYHKYIESDSAFNRRVQSVVVAEPSAEKAIEIIRNSITDFEKFHAVHISDECIDLAVKLSDRYIKSSFLPDKAYTILDQAAAKAKLTDRKSVDQALIYSVVSKIGNIDVNKLHGEEKKNLLKLEETISKRLIGQEQAVKTVAKAIRRSKAGISRPNKPVASFLFVGPTGVGKTELCKILSDNVAMGEKSLIKIDMSEFSEKSSISRLIGTTAGYIGYGEGGQLTEKVKHNPFSIVLLDEIEKAHPEVFNLFLQLLDEGKLTDGEGTTVDFTNCIIIMTSNAGYGAEEVKKHLGFGAVDDKVDPRMAEKKAHEALSETFRPEFLNRIDNIVIFNKLSKEECKEIVKIALKKVSDRLKEQKITVTFANNVIDSILEKGFSDKYGARNINREVQDTIEDFLADKVLDDTLYEGCKATVSYKKDMLSVRVKEK